MIRPCGSIAEAQGTGVMADELAELNDLLQRAFRYALSLTHDREWAEELVQDACLSIVRGNGPWRVQYMIVIIRNRHIDLCRRRQAIKFDSLGTGDIVSLPAAFDEPIDPELDAALAFLTGCPGYGHKGNTSGHSHMATDSFVSPHDPVCGRTVDMTTREFTEVTATRSYSFCSSECREKFRAAPGDYSKRNR